MALEIGQDLNYQYIYYQLIQRAKTRTPIEGYVEKHHIVPKSLGGSDFADNLVKLTAREHYIAHLLLAHIYGGMQWAAIMAFKSKKTIKSSRIYEMARIKSIQAQTFVTDEDIIGSAQPFTKPSIWKKNFPSNYVLARKRGLLERCTSHMIDKRFVGHYKTIEDVKEALRKSTCRKDFQKSYRGAFDLVRKNGWGYLVDERHPLKVEFGKWTKEACAKEAKNFFTRGEFQQKSGSAYVTARKNGWLDDICSHMTSIKTDWDKEKIDVTLKDYQICSMADLRKKLPKLSLWLYRHKYFLEYVKKKLSLLNYPLLRES